MKFHATTSDVENVASVDDLCELAELMGYKDTGRFAINQLQCNNGAFVSSLLSFFEDNPGAIEAVCKWVSKEYESELTENDQYEDDDEDDDIPRGAR